MKRKWSILIEYDADNLLEFEHAFFTESELTISREFVKGIMAIDEGEANDR